MQEGNAVRGIEGTFRLVRCEVRWSDGEVNWPYGEDAEGLLVYTSTGFVTGHLMRRNVPKFRTGARRAPSEQIHEAFLGYLGYYGTYEVNVGAGTVTHHVLGGWHPNWTGTDQVRHFRFDGEELVIETPPVNSGSRSRKTRLVWRRAASAKA
jgi:hypothetical protein